MFDGQMDEKLVLSLVGFLAVTNLAFVRLQLLGFIFFKFLHFVLDHFLVHLLDQDVISFHSHRAFSQVQDDALVHPETSGLHEGEEAEI